MKQLLIIIVALVLMLSAPLSGVGAETPPPGATLSIDQIPGGFQGPKIKESSASAVVVRFKSPIAVSGGLAYGTDEDYGSVIEIANVKPGANYDVKVNGLTAGMTYHYRLTLADATGQTYESGDLVFTTPPPAAAGGVSTERPKEENVASVAAGARVRGVSSNLNQGDNSSEFGALKAIDGLDSTRWASNGDGNQAWIEIGFAQKYNINAIGFRSGQEPDGSGRVSHFTVTTDEGKTVGPFELPNTDHIYYFPVDLVAHSLRFNTVETSGGNAGAVAIEAFGTPAG